LSVLDSDKIKKNGKKTKDEKSEIIAKEKFVLSISENGFGKKTTHSDYRVTNRGGKGIIGIVNSPRNGNITSSFPVNEGDEIFYLQIKAELLELLLKK
jgi:DNA gyrase subunit A